MTAQGARDGSPEPLQSPLLSLLTCPHDHPPSVIAATVRPGMPAMSRLRASLVLVAGLAAIVWGCVLLGGALLAALAEQPVAALAASAVESADGATAELTPGRDARLVVDLELATDSVQETLDAAGARWHGRYRIPLTYRVRNSAGADIAAEDSAVDWRDDSGDMSGRARQSSLSEVVVQMGADGGRLTATAVFRSFEAPDDGVVRVAVERAADRTYGARVEHVRYRIEHDLGSHASAVAGGLFALVAGWVLAVVGFVLVLAGERAPGSERSVDLPALDDVQATRVRRLAMACHLAALIGYVLPFGNVIGPLVVWLLNRERHPYIDEQGREAVNFQLSMLVWYLLAFALVLALVGFFMLVGLVVFQLVMVVVAAVRANGGEAWRYPLTVRFLR